MSLILSKNEPVRNKVYMNRLYICVCIYENLTLHKL